MSISSKLNAIQVFSADAREIETEAFFLAFLFVKKSNRVSEKLISFPPKSCRAKISETGESSNAMLT